MNLYWLHEPEPEIILPPAHQALMCIVFVFLLCYRGQFSSFTKLLIHFATFLLYKLF